MPTVTPVLRTSKLNAKGTAPIYLRIADRDTTRYVSLGIRIKPSAWVETKGRVSKSHKDAEEFNTLISDRVADLEREILRSKVDRVEATAAELASTLKPKRKRAGDFFAYAQSITDDVNSRGQHYLYKRYKSIFGKFKDFTGSPLPFDKITPELLRRYETHLRTHHQNNANTVQTNFNAIRAVFRRAIREGYADQGANPFFFFKPEKVRRPERGKLSAADIEAIEALELPKGSLLWDVRNYFLFSFYAAGIRFGDLAKLTHDQIVQEHGRLRLVYRMSKTGTLKSVPLVPPAQAILGLYERRKHSPFVFPLLDGYDLSTEARRVSAIGNRNALVNKYLKEIAKRAGIQTKLSFHVSRHSFADIARRKGWGVYDISKALGHANLKVTETYLKGFDAEALDEKMDALFS